MTHSSERQRTEEAFFDRYAGEVDIGKLASLPLFSGHAFENRYAAEVMGSLRGLFLLDLGCGWGEDAVWFAEQGACTVGVDISPRMLSLAAGHAARRGVRESVFPLRAAAESLPFADGSFDVVFGRGTLHHVDVPASLKEVYRVMKPGGVAVFSEPLADNPVLNIYRRLNRSIRSPLETPIRYRDLPRIGSGFDLFEHREFKLFAMIVLVWYYCRSKLAGTFYTGWFRDLDCGIACRRAYAFFQRLDAVVLRAFPRLGRWCWLTVIVGRKAPVSGAEPPGKRSVRCGDER